MKLSELLKYPQIDDADESDGLVLSTFKEPMINEPEVEAIIAQLIDATSKNQVFIALHRAVDLYRAGKLEIDVDLSGEPKTEWLYP